MSKVPFTERVSEFRAKFQKLLGSKHEGYDELNALDRPLMSAQDETDEYEREHGVPRPADEGNTHAAYRPPPVGDGATTTPSFSGAGIPTQGDEIQELSLLSKDAAGILWEMGAMEETGGAVADMRSKAEQLQAQLRGLISDYSGRNEALMAQAIDSFEMLSLALENQRPASEAPQAAPPPAAEQPPQGPVSAAQDTAAPLISFDP